MSANIKEIADAKPTTTVLGDDLVYFGRSPYNITDDRGILWGDAVKMGKTVQVNTITGVDDVVTGRGSILLPYATIEAAIAANTGTSVAPIVINISPGTYNLIDLSFKPSIKINGSGVHTTIINVTNPITVDSTCAGKTAFIDISNLTINANINFDTSAFSGTSDVIIRAETATLIGTTSNIIASVNNRILLGLYTRTVYGMVTTNANSNVAIEGIDSLFESTTLNMPSTISGKTCVFSLQNSSFYPTTINVSNSSGALATIGLKGCSIISGNLINITDVASGCNYEYDSISYTPFNIISGNPIITSDTLSDSINPNFTATNYLPSTPVSGHPLNVKNHLEGINNKVSTTAHAVLIGPTTATSPFTSMTALTDGQVVGGVTSSDPKPYTLIAGTNMTSIVPDAKGGSLTFNAATQGDASIFINTRIYTSAQGNDTTGDGSFNKPYRTRTKALSVSFPNDAIVMLNSDTENNILWLPQRYLVQDAGFPTLTCNSFNLDPTWGNASTSLVIDGVNIVCATAMNWDNSAFNASFNYLFKLLNMTLNCSSGFNFDALPGKSKLILNNVDTVSNSISICDITLNHGADFETHACNLGTVFVKCDSASATTSAVIDGGTIFKNGSNQGILGYSPLTSVNNATVSIEIKNLAQRQPFAPQLITLHQTGQTNVLKLNQDSGSYKRPSISGAGIEGIDYFLVGSGSTDGIVFDGNNTLGLSTFINFNFAIDAVQSINTLTQAMKGLDESLAITETDVFFSAYGNNISIARAQTNPVLSFSYLLTQITDASIFKVYNAYRQGDVSEASAVALKSWINVRGDGCEWQIGANPLTLDATDWSTAGNKSITIDNHALISSAASIDFDLSGFPAGNYALNLSNLKTFGKDINIIGTTGLNLDLYNIDQTVSPTTIGTASLNITNCNVLIRDALNYNFVFTATGSANYLIKIVNNRSANQTTINSNGTGIVNLIALNNASPLLLSTTTGALNSYLDAISASDISYSGSPAYPTLITSAEGIAPGFTPANYTPTSQSVKGHLEGIDNEFAAISGNSWPPGYINGLKLTWSDPTNGQQITISPGKCVDSLGAFNINSPDPLIIDITVSGDLGLDTGSYSTSTWYAIYLIEGGGFVSAIFSASFTSPDLPVGYTKFRLIGTSRSATIGTILMTFFQFGNSNERTYYWDNADTALGVLLNGNAVIGAPGTVNCIGAMSPISNEISLNSGFVPDVAAHNFFITSPSYNTLDQITISGPVMGQNNNNSLPWLSTNDSQQISYFVQDAADNLELFGIAYKEYV